MVGKRRVGRPRKTYRRHRGAGIFSDIWSGVKKAANWIKDNKVISRVAKLIPHPKAAVVGDAAEKLGLGRRRGRRPGPKRGRQRGRGLVVGSSITGQQVAAPRF